MQILAFNMKEGDQMNDKYYEQAAACVKDRVLPAQMELYRSCNGDTTAPQSVSCRSNSLISL